MDSKKARGVWILPTRRRIQSLDSSLRAAIIAEISTPGIILVDQAEYAELKPEYDGLTLPVDWRVMPVPADGMCDKLRYVFEEYLLKQAERPEWVGLLGDDVTPRTPAWDALLIGALEGWNIVSCNDNYAAPNRMAGATVFSWNVLEAVGFLHPPLFKHCFGDDFWENLGRATNNWAVRMDVLVEHNTPFKTGGEGDETHKLSYSHFEHDKAQWEVVRQTVLPLAIEAVEALKARMGIVRRQLNVEGMSLFIATPAHDGKYVHDYVQSLMTTALGLAGKGVPFKWVVENGNADICAARAELLSHFYESGMSHMLFIDSDMGWEPDAVYRLIFARKDFVAIAGRKKRETPIFAVNPMNANGKVVAIPCDQELGVCEVQEVGMAFVLLSRECVARMIDAYPDLKYTTPGDHARHSLFMPGIFGDRYKAEDYAFCHRWKAIGGEVFVTPDVRLKHVGVKTYEGAWADTWNPPEMEAAE